MDLPPPHHHATDLSHPVLSDRIQAIVATEKSIDEMMKCAREIISDLGKEKQIGKGKMEDNANQFKRLITQVENELSSQMQYLSHVCVGSSHQGSTFGTLQNALLAQSGCSSLHAELADIVSSINPPDVVDEEDEVELMEGSSRVSGSQSGSRVSGSAPASQESQQSRPADDVAMTSSSSETGGDVAEERMDEQ